MREGLRLRKREREIEKGRIRQTERHGEVNTIYRENGEGKRLGDRGREGERELE